MEQKKPSVEYILTHLGEEDAANTHFGAVIPPIFETSLHVFPDIETMFDYRPGEKGHFLYGRSANPTTRLLEEKLAALEGADDAVCFASGMAAISSAILHCVAPGAHVVTIKNVYGPTHSFFSDYLKKYGVETTFVSGTDPDEFERAIRPNTKLFYLENPTSLVMEVLDLKAIIKMAKARGIMTAIDNTWATPVNQRPLDLGIDISLHTMSKYIGGHSDLIGGVLCANAQIVAAVRGSERELFGGILGPFEAWLAIRGLRTMKLRAERSGANALAVAEFLDKHPRVSRVHYPLLRTHPQYALASAQLRGGTGLLSVEIDAPVEDVMKVANALELFRLGVSWGGFESLCCMPMAKMTEEEARDRNGARQLLRLYCGIEEISELIADVERALAVLD
jgi:cystathionine gamma-lyase